MTEDRCADGRNESRPPGGNDVTASATASTPASIGDCGSEPHLHPSVLVGLIGKGIQKSRTPFMHEREGARRGFRYLYKLLDTDQMGETPPGIAALVESARQFGFRGLNVTYPYKQSVIPCLSSLTPDAEVVGAVNTVRFDGGEAVGHNTDYAGFAESFRRSLPGRAHGVALQLGAGGAGAAITAALLSCGVERILVHDINATRVDELVARFGSSRVSRADDLVLSAGEADGIVNTTPVGMASHPGAAIGTDLIRPDMWVADIIYFPIETELLRAARAKGADTMGGREMAIFQAAFAFEFFTGVAADVDAMGRDFDALSDGSTPTTSTA